MWIRKSWMWVGQGGLRSQGSGRQMIGGRAEVGTERWRCCQGGTSLQGYCTRDERPCRLKVREIYCRGTVMGRQVEDSRAENRFAHGLDSSLYSPSFTWVSKFESWADVSKEELSLPDTSNIEYIRCCVKRMTRMCSCFRLTPSELTWNSRNALLYLHGHVCSGAPPHFRRKQWCT